MRVEVVYALPDRQVLLKLEVKSGATIGDAIAASGMLQRFPEIDVTRAGVFGRIAKLDDRLQPGDRVELYRPLVMDPKEARRRRARKKAQPG